MTKKTKSYLCKILCVITCFLFVGCSMLLSYLAIEVLIKLFLNYLLVLSSPSLGDTISQSSAVLISAFIMFFAYSLYLINSLNSIIEKLKNDKVIVDLVYTTIEVLKYGIKNSIWVTEFLIMNCVETPLRFYKLTSYKCIYRLIKYMYDKVTAKIQEILNWGISLMLSKTILNVRKDYEGLMKSVLDRNMFISSKELICC